MADIATISAFIGSIKTATDIAKTIKGADLSLEKAEAKLKMAELISALADAKIQAAEIQDLLQQKDEKIKNLEKSLESKSKMIFQKGRYYEVDESNSPIEEPYCSNCWEGNHKAIHLNDFGGIYICPACHSKSLLD